MLFCSSRALVSACFSKLGMVEGELKWGYTISQKKWNLKKKQKTCESEESFYSVKNKFSLNSTGLDLRLSLPSLSHEIASFFFSFLFEDLKQKGMTEMNDSFSPNTKV